MRRLVWQKGAWNDYLYWQNQDRKTRRRINRLIDDICRESPFSGIGKPEPLRGDLAGFWSRRIDDTNRLIYKITDHYIVVVSCRYHY